MRLLKLYEQAFKEGINKIKTSLSFSKNVPMNSRRLMIKALWCAVEVTEPAKYLGLPQVVKQAKNRTLLKLKQKVLRKLQG